MNIYGKMIKEQKRIEAQINNVKSKLENFPEGKLISSINWNSYKYYLSDGHTKTYIPAENRELARQLAWKKYWTCMLEDLGQEKRAVDAYLKQKNGKKKHMEELIEKDHGCMELLKGTIRTRSQMLEEWLQAEYQTNPEFPEHLIHNTVAGHKVRSKSEAMIVMYLYNNQIPYRYECALTLDGVTLYPDFTIKHPKTGQIYYWEHFGKMDDEKYVRKTQRKFQMYTSNGIIPTIQLITTYETKDNPLDIGTIEEIVEKYFK
ncbi:MAG: ATPase [Lachnospiraceae bacterium]|nr:ATPase [Lachnospiraceae bacterium]